METKKLPDNFWTLPANIDPFAEYAPHDGAEIEKIEPFSEELETIVQQMWKDMTTETKILEGTLDVEYKIEGEFVTPKSVAGTIPIYKGILENEQEIPLSEEKDGEEQENGGKTDGVVTE